MPDKFDVILDLKPLQEVVKDLNALKEPINRSVEKLAMAAFNQAIALANQKLKNEFDKKLYIDNLHWQKNSTGGFDSYLIILEEKALGLEDGTKPIDMRKTHLKNRDWVRIPFTHPSSGSSKLSPKKAQILQEIKTAMRQNNLPTSKPIKDQSGKPILSDPNKPRAAALIKKVESTFKGSVSNKSILNNLNVYQSERKTKSGKTVIDRTYMTFRTLSHNSKAKWVIPGKSGVGIFDEVYRWIQQNYQQYLDKALANINLAVGP